MRRGLPFLTVKSPRTVNVSEIAELLGVTHQRASVIVRQPGVPALSGTKARAASGIGVRSRRGRRSGAARNRGGSRSVYVEPCTGIDRVRMAHQ